MISGPFLWFSQLIGGNPKPRHLFPMDGIMVNAYEITSKPASNKKVREKGIHRYLNFNGPVMMDSGGFQLMKKHDLKIETSDIIQLYEESEPDFGVVLDHPLGPNLSAQEKMRRWKKTLNNTRIMISREGNGSTTIVPAIHGYSEKEIEWFLNELNKIGSFPYIGIGSLVPSVFNTKGAGGISNVIQILILVRSKIPDTKIHVFGVGSTLTMHLMFYAGADSVDSSGWRTKAAYGAIQLSGIGDRYITKRKRNKKYLDLSKEEINIIEKCQCPICRNQGLDELRAEFKARAIHNAWVYQREVEKARELIDKDEYRDYVKGNLAHSPFSKTFDFIEKLKLNTNS